MSIGHILETLQQHGGAAVSASDPTPPLFVDAREAARLLSISRAEVYNILAAGRMTSVKHGKRRLIRLDEVHRFADSLVSSVTASAFGRAAVQTAAGATRGEVARTPDDARDA